MPGAIKYEDWKANASIDYITVELPAKLRSPAYLSRFKLPGQGNLEFPSRLGRSAPHGCDWVSIHNPDRETLQYLINEFPRAQLLAFEISIDLRPKVGVPKMADLLEAHAWLKHALFPDSHKQMRGQSRRSAYHLREKSIRRIGLKAKPEVTTVYWENRTAFEKVRLYVKTKDKHRSPIEPSVRLEVTFNRGGCQEAGIARLEDFPAFAERSRRYLSPFFDIASGIKPKLKRLRATKSAKAAAIIRGNAKELERVDRAWAKYGATWAAKHGYSILSDKIANRLIGGALNELRRTLKKLELP